jgi:hypothetical protein
MTARQVGHLIRLNKKAEQHANEYKRLSKDGSAQSQAIKHLQKAERLHSQVRDLIRAST